MELRIKPHSQRKKRLLALMLTTLTSLSVKANTPNGITPDNINLSTADFLPEFISEAPERRTAARLYLLGVLESTEGRAWCSYQQVNTAAINDIVFEYLKKQPKERQTIRASELIEEALQHYFPCKDTK